MFSQVGYMIFFFRNYSDLSAIMSSRSAQVTHAISHHLYTNTYMDHETIAFYPIVSFFSLDKSVVHRYMVKNICQIIVFAQLSLFQNPGTHLHPSLLGNHPHVCIHCQSSDSLLEAQTPGLSCPSAVHRYNIYVFKNIIYKYQYFPAIAAFTELSWLSCFGRWFVIQMVGSYWLFGTTVTSTHHDPSVYHPGRFPSHFVQCSDS